MTYTPTNPLQDLNDQRARQMLIIDDVIDSARAANRVWTDEELVRYNAAVAGVDALDVVIRSLSVRGEPSIRRAYDVPNINVRGTYSVGAGDEANRSLDAMLWATDEVVRAGSYDRAGNFVGQYGAINPVEQVIVRSDVGDVGFTAPRITEYGPDHRNAVRSFQKLTQDMVFFGMMVDNGARSSRDGFEIARSHRLYRDQWNQICRAMDVDTSGEGGNWVPTGIGAAMHERVRAMGKVAPLFATINLPTNPWKMPIEGTDPTVYRIAEPTGDTETKMTVSTPGTVALTFDAEIFGSRSLWSRSLDADSAVAIMLFYQRKFAQAFADAREKAILDGDTDGTHQDSDIGASTTAAVTAWDGLRKKALAETTQATTTTSAANLAIIRKAMGLWGANPEDLAYIVGMSSYHVLLSDANLLTVDKMGPNATILNGQIGSIYGIPVIVSQWVRETLNATGVYDGITTTKTYALCVNRNQWAIGSRMPIDIEVDDSIYRETYQRLIVGFERLDFQNLGSASTDEDTSIGYNITTGS